MEDQPLPAAAKATTVAHRTTTTTSTTSMAAHRIRGHLQARAVATAASKEAGTAVNTAAAMEVSTVAHQVVAMAANRADMAAHNSPGGSTIQTRC